MPIYEYKCQNKVCSHKLDKLQKISEQPLKKCPECDQDTLQKLVSAAAFHLKGNGWYATDFKDKKDKQETTASKDATEGKS